MVFTLDYELIFIVYQITFVIERRSKIKFNQLEVEQKYNFARTVNAKILNIPGIA